MGGNSFHVSLVMEVVDMTIMDHRNAAGATARAKNVFLLNGINSGKSIKNGETMPSLNATVETAGTYYSVEILVFFQDGNKDWFPQSEHLTFQEALDAAAKLNTTNMIYIDEMHRDAEGNASGTVVWKGYNTGGKLVIESYMQPTAAACMERMINVCEAV